jgi:hypothetical protein
MRQRIDMINKTRDAAPAATGLKMKRKGADGEAPKVPLPAALSSKVATTNSWITSPLTHRRKAPKQSG